VSVDYLFFDAIGNLLYITYFGW